MKVILMGIVGVILYCVALAIPSVYLGYLSGVLSGVALMISLQPEVKNEEKS